MKTHTTKKPRNVLLQTRVPVDTAEALKRAADDEGITNAAFLRRLTLGVSKIQPPAQAAPIYTRDVSYDIGEKQNKTLFPGAPTPFSFTAPHAFRMEAIEFDGDYVIEDVMVGNYSILGPTGATVPTTDFPEHRLVLTKFVGAREIVRMSVTTKSKCEFSARITGKREAARTRPRDKSANFGGRLDIATFHGGLVDPGETKSFTYWPPCRLRVDRIVTDNHEAFTLERAEVGRDPQISDPLPLEHSTPLPMVESYGEEIRLFVKNISKSAAAFTARLHGMSRD